MAAARRAPVPRVVEQAIAAIDDGAGEVLLGLEHRGAGHLLEVEVAATAAGRARGQEEREREGHALHGRRA
jgi:hypothetical protein